MNWVISGGPRDATSPTFCPKNLPIQGRHQLNSTLPNCIGATLHETNIAPENGWLEDEFPFGMADFQGLC